MKTEKQKWQDFILWFAKFKFDLKFLKLHQNFWNKLAWALWQWVHTRVEVGVDVGTY